MSQNHPANKKPTAHSPVLKREASRCLFSHRLGEIALPFWTLTRCRLFRYLGAVNPLDVTAIIPARYGSSRLPGKPLLEIAGKPMIVWVYQRARRARRVRRVIVATDDERIAEVIRRIGGEVRMTSPHHRSGTERVAEVAETLDADVIVNVQGDEPLIEPAAIDAAIEPLLLDSTLEMATTSEPITTATDIFDPNVVKVVTDSNGFALYFSRQPIPYPREAVRQAGSLQWALEQAPSLLQLYRKHSGLYAYRRSRLLELARWPPTPLEQAEQLEQLRALEHGIRIKVVALSRRSLAVDTADDLERVRALIARGERKLSRLRECASRKAHAPSRRR